MTKSAKRQLSSSADAVADSKKPRIDASNPKQDAGEASVEKDDEQQKLALHKQPRWVVDWPKATPEAVKAIYLRVLETRNMPGQTLITRAFANSMTNYLIDNSYAKAWLSDKAKNPAALTKSQLIAGKKLFCYDEELKELMTAVKENLTSKPIVLVDDWNKIFLKLHVSEKTGHKSGSKTLKAYEAEYGFGMSEDIIEAFMLTCETCHPGKSGKAIMQVKVTAGAERKEALQAFTWKPKLTADQAIVLGKVATSFDSEIRLAARQLFFELFVRELFVREQIKTSSVSAKALETLYNELCQHSQHDSNSIADLQVNAKFRVNSLVNTFGVEVTESKGDASEGNFFWGLKPKDADARKILHELQECMGKHLQVLKTRKA